MIGLLAFLVHTLSLCAAISVAFKWWLPRIYAVSPALSFCWRSFKWFIPLGNAMYFFTDRTWPAKAFDVAGVAVWIILILTDDDSDSKRLARKAWGKVVDLGHRLTVVPHPHPA